MQHTPDRETLKGISYGVAAYAFWGFVAVYFKFVDRVAPLEILAHRIIWSVVVLSILITLLHRWRAIAAVLATKRSLLYLLISTLLIAVNWFVFIWAVTHSRLVEASMGYFINPLVNVLLGFLFLRERLTRTEWASIALAAIAVTWLTVAAGVFPWISLILAASFGLYGLVRKLAGVASIEGLAIETTMLFPVAIAYLIYRQQAGTLSFLHDSTGLDLLLLAAGPLTTLPLLWFAAAVSRLRLATVGLLQYIAPTIQFLFAVVVYSEPFGRNRFVAFALIWVAIAIYSVDNFRNRGRRVVVMTRQGT